MSESLGSILKKIRESKGLSLEDVSERTRVSKNIISSIEKDNLGEISSDFYARNFVRLYAEFLGASEEKPVKDFLIRTAEKKDASKAIGVSKEVKGNLIWLRDKRYGFRILLVMLAIFVLGIGFLGAKKFTKILYSRYKTHQKLRPTRQTKTVQIQPVKVKGPTASRQILTIQPEEKTNLIVKEKKDTYFELKIEARSSTPIQVTKKDGSLLFKGTLKKGSSDIWKAEDELVVELGNAGAVVFSIDGKNIGSPGKKGEKKRLRVTKEGILE